MTSDRRLLMLEGSPHASVALPLDYPPSRKLAPRWREAPIAPLLRLCRAGDDGYAHILMRMEHYRNEMAHVALTPIQGRDPTWFAPFAAFDLAALYAIVRDVRPKRYVEIGSGDSTRWVRRAIEDGGLETTVTAIDPQPRVDVEAVCDVLIRKGLEESDLSFFADLVAGDIVFFDGSHRSFMNSDVTVFMIEVLPRLAPGVLVHIHDVTLPWDYPEWAINWYWNEQYLLAAYMIAAQARVRTVFPTTYVCREPRFDSWFAEPLIDLAELNAGWRGGGSMWLTHT